MGDSATGKKVFEALEKGEGSKKKKIGLACWNSPGALTMYLAIKNEPGTVLKLPYRQRGKKSYKGETYFKEGAGR